MKKLMVIFLLMLTYSVSNNAFNSKVSEGEDQNLNNKYINEFYQAIKNTQNKPCFNLFCQGITGYFKLLNKGLIENTKYLTLIDYSLSSKVRRLWVIDMNEHKIVYNTLVAHGKNTGEEFAEEFSNAPNSNKSSLGFFLTGGTYDGKHGLSLILDGIEKEINDNARERAIVIHGAEYATYKYIDETGRLGRSFGCPALPPVISAEIIGTIKDKSVLFIYFPNKEYFSKSDIVNKTVS